MYMYLTSTLYSARTSKAIYCHNVVFMHVLFVWSCCDDEMLRSVDVIVVQ